MMDYKTHHVKCQQPWFGDIKDNRKLHEIRTNDRDYEVGDILVLEEYVGDKAYREVTYLTDGDKHPEWCPPGKVIMPIRPLVSFVEVDSGEVIRAPRVSDYPDASSYVCGVLEFQNLLSTHRSKLES